ncbi:MAG: transglutaminase domain-containing protein [Clostridiales bacterium]|nr:transglutaminase domain-containing protein [Clostridiales bacterium]
MMVSKHWQRRRRSMAALVLLIILSVAGLCETLHLILPRADGIHVWEENGAFLDASNAEDGYVMVKKESGKKLKVRILWEDITYTYDLAGDGEFEVYPLQKGSGSYKVLVYENVKGNSYAQVLSHDIEATMENEHAAFLCPNRYVDYDGETQVIKYADEMLSGVKSDREKADTIGKWMKKSFGYDYILALTAKSGYIPDIDATFKSRMGMCFDFSSIMCAIMRSQGIPAQLVMGDADGTYHAWCKILLDGKWVLFDPTTEITGKKVSNYTEEAYY